MDGNRERWVEPVAVTASPDTAHDLRMQFKRLINEDLTVVPVGAHEAMVSEGATHQALELPSGVYLTIGNGMFRDMATSQAQAVVARALKLAKIPTNEHDAKQALNGVFVSTPTFDRVLQARADGGFAFAQSLCQAVKDQRAASKI